MLFIDKMKNFKIYKTKTFLPTVNGNKKKGSAVLLMTPNYESSKKLMNNEMFVNSNRYQSYYLEKDVSYYINGKMVEEVEESTLFNDQEELDICLNETKRSELKDSEFGVSDKRKFPLDTEAHVRSAVKFFNYVDPNDEEELARKLIAALKKYNLYGKINVSDKNRFSNYYHAKKALKEALLEAADIPKYHSILSQLDLYYYGWKNGAIPEKKAREVIYQIMSASLATDGKIKSPETVPTPQEYYSKRGILPEDVKRESTDILSESMVANLPVNSLNLGDKVLFFNEANVNDTYLRRLLFKDRIKYRKDMLILLDQVKKDIPWIKFAFPEMKKYMGRNLFVDLYFYNALFFENNKWIAKRGMNLYLDFMSRLMNHPSLKANGYNKKTVFIPVKDWNRTRDNMIWNYKVSINPISCIYQLMLTNSLPLLQKTFGDTDIIFVDDHQYFKVNFAQMDAKEMKHYTAKFKTFVIKICNNESFTDEDIDTSADNKEDTEVIAAKIVDKVEKAKGIDLTYRVTTNLATSKAMKNLSPEKAKVISKDMDKINKFSITKNKDAVAPTYKNDSHSDTAKDIAKELERVNKALEDEDDDVEFDEDKAQAVEKLADYIAQASEDNDDEDSALDALDTTELKKLLANIGNDEEVSISGSRAARLTALDNALADKQINGRSIRDILSETPKESVKTTIDVNSPNVDEWSNLTYMNFDKNYDIDKDIVAIFKHFSTCTRPIVIRDIKAEDNSTSEDRVELYTVNYEDYKGRRYTIKLDIPTMVDNRFLLRGNMQTLQTQFFNMPIIKTDLNTCQLISNYKKIFIYRTNDANGRTLDAVGKLVKALKKYKGTKVKVTYGINTKVCSKYHLPMDYIDMAGIYSKIESDNWIIYFNQDEIRETYAIDEKKGIPYAYNKKLKAIEYINYNSDPNYMFISEILPAIFEADSNIEDLFASATRSASCAYTRAKVMATFIPVIVIGAYHVGLRTVMDKAGIKYEFVDKISRELKTDITKDWIEFEDGYIVYDVNYESSLLMNGLKQKGCMTELFKLSEIDNRNTYLQMLDNFGGKMKADGLDNFYDLFIDPMTRESLEYYNLPTDYVDILLYGSSLLADNKYVKHTDTSSRRIRRYQLISVYTYLVMSKAYNDYAIEDKHGTIPTFSVKQSAVIDAFLTDTIASTDSVINALRDVETTNGITTKGPSGMNADRAYSLDKRSYDESMSNVLGMSTGFSTNAGITRQATIDANVTADGYVKDNGRNKEMNDANTLTATEAMIPFGSTRDDPMRTAMSFIQTSKHSVRTEQSDPLLVTSGADEVLPYLTTDRFAFKAKNDGIVLEANENYILVEYKDKTKDYIDLKESIEKNSDGGYYEPLKLDAADGIKAKVKFKQDQILAYDRRSFSNSLGEGDNIAYNIGKLAKVAILNTDEGFEDSGIISASLAKKLATRITLKYDAVIDKDCRVFQIAKVGDHIEASDDLIIWEKAFDDEESNAVIAALSSDEFSDLGKKKLKSDVTGTLTGIKIYRTVELEELSPSLHKIVSEYEKPLNAEEKLLKSNGLPTNTVPAHYKLNPTGKMKRAQEAILIEFYVEYLDTVGVGDKVVYNAANKAVEKGIFPEGKEPYTYFRPNEPIDCQINDISISKRLVSSIIIYGSLQKLMIELDRSVKDIMGIPYDDSTV